MLALYASMVLCRLTTFVFWEDYNRLANLSFGVTTGHPLYRMWQSRVLGPYTIKAFTFGGLDYIRAHILFQILTVAIAAFLCWRLGRKYGGSDQSAVLAITLFVVSFALLLSPTWLCSWDFLDIIVVILLIDLVLAGASLRWFIILFAIAIFNRDSALFIPLWLIIDPLVRFFYQRRSKLPAAPLDWGRMLAGVVCIAAGFLMMELLRQSLLVEAIETANYYPFRVGYNIELLKARYLDRTFTFVIPAFLATVIALGACVVRHDPQRYLALYLIVIAFMGLNFVFSIMDETRIYLFLIPFIVISAVLLLRPAQSPPKGVECT